MNTDPVRQLLTEELEKRRLRNPSYSLRAFSRDTDVSLTALSNAMSGKRRLARKNIQRLSQALMLSPEHANSLLERAEPISLEQPYPHELLNEDVFRLIGEWHYFAILSLARLSTSKSSPKWIANRLGLEEDEAKEALSRLERLQFITIKNGRLERTSRPLRTTRDIPSVAIRKHHLGKLHLAEQALLNVPVEERDFVSTVTTMNMEQMAEIKKYLQKASDRVANLAEKGQPTEVYCINMQFFPLTKRRISK